MKQAIREEVLRRRDQIPQQVRTVKNSLIREKIFSLTEFILSRVILMYASFRSEVETPGMIAGAIESGKRVLMPKVDGESKQLEIYEIVDINELTPGYMGIPEPNLPEDRQVSIEETDIVLIPGTAYDYSGNRLGYGAGYYDRLLSGIEKEIIIVAPAFEEQLLDQIPAEEHDVKVDIIITDRQIIRI